MPTYAEALEALTKLEGGSELADAVRGEVKKKNDEASGLRKRLKPLEERVRKIAGAEESDDLDDVLERVEAATKVGGKGGKSDDRVAALEKTVEALKKTAETERAKATAAIVGGELKDLLIAEKIRRPEYHMKTLADRVKIDGEKRTFLMDDGTEADLKTGIKAWASAFPDFRESEQQPGPGGSGTRNQKPQEGTKTISRTEYTQAQASRDKATLDGVATGKITISD